MDFSSWEETPATRQLPASGPEAAVCKQLGYRQERLVAKILCARSFQGELCRFLLRGVRLWERL